MSGGLPGLRCGPTAKPEKTHSRPGRRYGKPLGCKYSGSGHPGMEVGLHQPGESGAIFPSLIEEQTCIPAPRAEPVFRSAR